MKTDTRVKRTIITVISSTAALAAAVFLGLLASSFIVSSGILLPDYSSPSYKTEYDGRTDLEFSQKGRRIEARRDGVKIWSLERECPAQDFLLADIDHDGENELVVLCWRQGRFGSKRPTWVREDEKTFSQHIFIYELSSDEVKPKWMASDIGVDAASFDFDDGILSITDNKNTVTYWRWNSWGMEKL